MLNTSRRHARKLLGHGFPIGDGKTNPAMLGALNFDNQAGE